MNNLNKEIKLKVPTFNIEINPFGLKVFNTKVPSSDYI